MACCLAFTIIITDIIDPFRRETETGYYETSHLYLRDKKRWITKSSTHILAL